MTKNQGIALRIVISYAAAFILYYLYLTYDAPSTPSLAVLFLSAGSVIVFIWACADLALKKGYSNVYGLIGLLGTIGLIILLVLPNKSRGAPPLPDN